MVRTEFIVAGGICLIIGLMMFLALSFGNSESYIILNGSGSIIIIESVLVMFVGMAYPERK